MEVLSLKIKVPTLKYKTTTISLRIKPTTQISNHRAISTLLTLLQSEIISSITSIPMIVAHGETNKTISLIQIRILIITIPTIFIITTKGSSPKQCLTITRIITTSINLILNTILLTTQTLIARTIMLLTDHKLIIHLIMPTIH